MTGLFEAIAQSNLLIEITSELLKDEFDLLKFLIIISYSIFIGILGLSGFGIWKSFNEIEGTINKQVDKKVADEIAKILEVKTDDVKTIIETESIIKQTRVKYFLPHTNAEQDIESLEEYKLLKRRRYQITPSKDYGKDTSFINCNVAILDFMNGQLVNIPKDEDNSEEILKVVRKVADNLHKKTTLVIYVKGFVQGLETIFDNHDKYYTPANNLVSLMGRVMDAAQITRAAKGLER